MRSRRAPAWTGKPVIFAINGGNPSAEFSSRFAFDLVGQKISRPGGLFPTRRDRYRRGTRCRSGPFAICQLAQFSKTGIVRPVAITTARPLKCFKLSVIARPGSPLHLCSGVTGRSSNHLTAISRTIGSFCRLDPTVPCLVVTVHCAQMAGAIYFCETNPNGRLL